MLKVTADWTGFTGGPGVTCLYFDGVFEGGLAVDQVATRASEFFAAVAVHIPSVAQIRVRAAVEQIDPVTGVLIGEDTTSTPPPAATGQASGAYSAPSGACISWGTGGVARGRRVRGKTFLVPLGNGAYEADGTLNNNILGFLVAAANGLIAPPLSAATDFGIWSRPVSGAGGSWHKATSCKISDKAAILTSRRD